MIYFTSDTHFGSQRALSLSKRPFKTVQEMDETLIANWNEIVSSNDIVFHLGDFGNYNCKFRLNGKINLIEGNYEEEDIKSGKITEDDLVYFYQFQSFRKEGQLDFSHINQCIQLHHKPSDINKGKNNFGLFGHIHGKQMCKRYGLDVGVDAHHFYPISLDTVCFYYNAIQNHYDDEVFN